MLREKASTNKVASASFTRRCINILSFVKVILQQPENTHTQKKGGRCVYQKHEAEFLLFFFLFFFK